MDKKYHGDLRINGSGSSVGGRYESVAIKGSGKIDGDLFCTMFSIAGSGLVEGNLETAEGKINGSGTIEGNLNAETFKINGSGKIRGSVAGNSFAVSGSGTVGENLNVQNVKIEGSVKVGHDCNAELFTASGTFEINGLLSADEVNIRLYHLKSRAAEIGGEKISVTVGPPAGVNILKTMINIGLLNPSLEAEVIEGDDIRLENTAANIVRGNNVFIGSGCDIGTVEYKGRYEKSADARVGAEVKI
jgi:cytoskeletal protein CcmA (bactofilin family)